MGQKINPIGFRLAVNKDWRSKWYAPKADFAGFLHSDLKIRNYLKGKLQFAALSPYWFGVLVRLRRPAVLPLPCHSAPPTPPPCPHTAAP